MTSRAITRRGWMAAAGAALLSGCTRNKLTLIRAETYPNYCRDGAACMAVDVHSHIFNGSDLPIDGFIRHIAPAPRHSTDRWLGKVTVALEGAVHGVAPSGANELAHLQQAGSRARVAGKGAIDKLAQVLSDHIPAFAETKYATLVPNVAKIVLSDRRYAAERLCGLYPDVKLFVPALVDFDYWSDVSKPITPLLDQIRVQAELSRLSMRGQLARSDVRFHPFVGFNPLKEVREVIDGVGPVAYEPFGRSGKTLATHPRLDGADEMPELDESLLRGSLDLVRYAVEKQGFIGVKLYPPTGFLPLGNAHWARHREQGLGEKLDLALRALYAYCEANQVPVMTHAANSNDYDFGYGMLAEPRGWGPVLDEYPSLHLSLGHFGHTEGSTSERGVAACESWARQASELMARAESNVYADMANSRLSIHQEERDEVRQVFVDLFQRQPLVKQRLMYGSDWWMSELDENVGASLRVFARDIAGCVSEPERQQLMADNALRFLGFSDPDHKNARRLHAFYRDVDARAPAPTWLKATAPGESTPPVVDSPAPAATSGVVGDTPAGSRDTHDQGGGLAQTPIVDGSSL